MCRFESCRPSQTDGCEEGMQDQIPLVVFSGRAHPQLTDRICDYLQIHRGEVRLYNFSDGENGCQIEENVRGGDVYVVQPTCPPVNDNLMELLILLDACRRSSATHHCGHPLFRLRPSGPQRPAEGADHRQARV